MDVYGRRTRGRRFSNAEDLALVEGVRKHGEFICSIVKNSHLKQQAYLAWEEICEAVNAVRAGSEKRTIDVVKRRYKDIRRVVRNKGYPVTYTPRQPAGTNQSAQLTAEMVLSHLPLDLPSNSNGVEGKEEEQEELPGIAIAGEPTPSYSYSENSYDEMNDDEYEYDETSSTDQLDTDETDPALERMIFAQEQMAITLQELVVEFRQDAEQRRREAANVTTILSEIRDGLLIMNTNMGARS